VNRATPFKLFGNALAFGLVMVSGGFRHPTMFTVPLLLALVTTADALRPKPPPKTEADTRYMRGRVKLEGWRGRLQKWFRPPRRLHFTRSGWAFTGGIFGIGFAALNTANNLLYLLLGGMLGLIVLSGWLSEQALRGLIVRRRVPRGITAREPARIGYEVTNRKKRMPTLALEVREVGTEQRAFIAGVPPGGTAFARADITYERRGIYMLNELTLATTFPFGLFIKERDVELGGSVVVWPRTDRVARPPMPGGTRARRMGSIASGAGGGRGEYRGLREYRSGDDPRDVHWRSTARLQTPVVREYERDESDTLWLCLDLRAQPGDVAEMGVEIAAALAASAVARGGRFGFASADTEVQAGAGAAQLDMVLDALAGARFRPNAPRVVPPAAPSECVLITSNEPDPRFGDVYLAERGGL
jgi:uncharacterized protein (DUF58 family)